MSQEAQDEDEAAVEDPAPGSQQVETRSSAGAEGEAEAMEAAEKAGGDGLQQAFVEDQDDDEEAEAFAED